MIGVAFTAGSLKRSEAEALAAANPTTIQTLIFAKDTFKNAGDAKAWANDHGFKADGVDETGDSYRIRQRGPGAFVTGSFRTISITDGVTAVIGKVKTTRVRCIRDMGGDDGVERPGPGQAPTAFRIWRAGENPTDHGTHVFSPRSAELLMSEQATRGNRYSIDVDHMSLNKESPPTARYAVGWHALEVRGGELWATDLEWGDTVRAGLESKPPAWRYFSPAYDVDPETGEIISYLNTALTNNPATWNVTALASRAGEGEDDADERKGPVMAMKMHEIMGELARTARESEDSEDAEKARQALQKLMPAPPSSSDAPGKGDGDKDEDDDEDTKTPPAPPKKDGEDKPKEPPAADDEDAKKASVAATRGEADLLRQMGEQDRRLRELEADRESRERTTILASRPDLTKSQREYLTKQPVARMRELLDLIPAPPAKTARRNPAAVDSIAATRGDSQRSAADDGLDPETARRIDIQCGITPQANAIVDEGEGGVVLANRVASGGFTRTYNTMTPEAAREFLANKNKPRGQGVSK